MNARVYKHGPHAARGLCCTCRACLGPIKLSRKIVNRQRRAVVKADTRSAAEDFELQEIADRFEWNDPSYGECWCGICEWCDPEFETRVAQAPEPLRVSLAEHLR